MDSQDKLTILVEEITAGHTLAQAGLLVGLSACSVYRRIKDLPLERVRRPRLSQEERCAIINALRRMEKTRRQIGAKFGRSASTVQRIAKSLRRPGEYRVLAQPVRCPQCGRLVTFWPCVACEVESKHAKPCD